MRSPRLMSLRAKRSGHLGPVLAAASLALAACLALPAAALAQRGGGSDGYGGKAVTIQELVDHMEEYDGRVVTVEGEVIGDVMRRGDNAWIAVNDDAYSESPLDESKVYAGYSNMGIGIWISTAFAGSIEYCGGYQVRGDRFAITGTFHRACPEHGGDTDIHATELLLVERGHRIFHPFDYTMLLVALGLLGVSLLLWSLLRRKVKAARQRERGTTHTD